MKIASLKINTLEHFHSTELEGRGGLTSHIRSPIWEMSGKNHLLGQARREEGRDFSLFYLIKKEKEKKKKKKEKETHVPCHDQFSFLFFSFF